MNFVNPVFPPVFGIVYSTEKKISKLRLYQYYKYFFLVLGVMYIKYFYQVILSTYLNMFFVVKRTEGSVIHCALYKSRFIINVIIINKMGIGLLVVIRLRAIWEQLINNKMMSKIKLECLLLISIVTRYNKRYLVPLATSYWFGCKCYSVISA